MLTNFDSIHAGLACEELVFFSRLLLHSGVGSEFVGTPVVCRGSCKEVVGTMRVAGQLVLMDILIPTSSV
jgi:hypothetical protein